MSNLYFYKINPKSLLNRTHSKEIICLSYLQHCSFTDRSNCEGRAQLIYYFSDCKWQSCTETALHCNVTLHISLGWVLLWVDFDLHLLPFQLSSLVYPLDFVIHLHEIHHHIRMWSIGFYTFWFLFLTVAPPDMQWDQEHDISDSVT